MISLHQLGTYGLVNKRFDRLLAQARRQLLVGRSLRKHVLKRKKKSLFKSENPLKDVL